MKTFSMRLPSLLTALFLAVAVMATALPAGAQRRNNDEPPPERQFSPDIGELVVRGQEAVESGNLQRGQQVYEQALNDRNITPYEKGVILQLLAQIALERDDTRGVINYLSRAMNEGDLLPQERQNTLFNLGNLYLQIENYAQGASFLERFIREGGRPTEQLYNNLVFAYVEQGQPRQALDYARRAFDIAQPKKRQNYDTLNFLYTELNMPRERAALLQEMVQLYPQDKSIWTSIAALYAQGDQESKAFEIRKIMYINGMLTEENEIQTIVDYYSYYDVPYRAAEILKREMNRGRVERNQRNLEKLARFYRQAQEFDLAIEPLTAAAEASGDGTLFRQLGEAFYAEGELDQAETFLRRSLDRGVDRPGEIWVLIGNVLYEQGQRQNAIEAFEQANRFPYSRRDGTGWISFIRSEIEAEQARREFELSVEAEELRVLCERRQRGTDLLESSAVINPRTGQQVDCDAILGDADDDTDIE